MPCRLYLITPPQLELAQFVPRLKDALEAGAVACLQLRLQDASDKTWRDAAEALRPLAHGSGARFLLNDRADLVRACNADGVHLGPSDMGLRAARKLLGADAIIGASCQASRHLAMEAGGKGADYVSFGSFFPSQTKASPHRPRPDILRWWQEVAVLPCMGIGGITPANAGALVRAGADFLAVSHAIWAHPEGAGAGVRTFAAPLALARQNGDT